MFGPSLCIFPSCLTRAAFGSKSLGSIQSGTIKCGNQVCRAFYPFDYPNQNELLLVWKKGGTSSIEELSQFLLLDNSVSLSPVCFLKLQHFKKKSATSLECVMLCASSSCVQVGHVCKWTVCERPGM